MPSMTSTTVILSNGQETFSLGAILEDEHGAVHGIDCSGAGYTRCDAPHGDCDHEEHEGKPEHSRVWHDDEHTETLWEVGSEV